jgi:predicted enzyme related to lactoylglutathione lyase
VTSSILAVVVDCHDVHAVAAFWAAALDRVVVARETHELRVGDPERDATVLYFMSVPEAKTVKNRVHIDLVTDTPLPIEVARLAGLGARVVAEMADPPEHASPDRWTVLADPEGNEFCVTSRADLTGWFD